MIERTKKMLDINYIKENPAEVVERLAAKGKDAAEDIAKILELDAKRRTLITETEAIKADMEALEKSFYAVSEKLYKDAGAQADPNANQGGTQGADGTYYDADFEDKTNN